MGPELCSGCERVPWETFFSRPSDPIPLLLLCLLYQVLDTPAQIKTEILSRNYGLSAIAAEQGVLFNRLYPIEQKAVNDMLDAETTAGYVSVEETSRWKNEFWNHPGKLDNVVQSMFSGLPVDISY